MESPPLSLKNLIAHVRPNTLGIIWAIEKDLNEFPPYFVELDYLLDGQLKKQINQKEQENLSRSLFVNQHFSGHLYLLLLKTSSEKKISDLLNENKNALEIMKKSNPLAHDLIFLAGDNKTSKNDTLNLLKKMFPEGTHLVM